MYTTVWNTNNRLVMSERQLDIVHSSKAIIDICHTSLDKLIRDSADNNRTPRILLRHFIVRVTSRRINAVIMCIFVDVNAVRDMLRSE